MGFWSFFSPFHFVKNFWQNTFVWFSPHAPLIAQEDNKDPIVIAKFFNPTGAGTWLATEYDPNSKESFNFGLLAAKRFENGGTEAKKVIFKTIGSYLQIYCQINLISKII